MNPLSIECDVHFTKHGRGRKELESGAEPSEPTPGRVPRVARLLALAHRLERLLRARLLLRLPRPESERSLRILRRRRETPARRTPAN
jgi:hypothetical protein